MTEPVLVSIQAALPQEIQTPSGPLRTGMRKMPVAGPILLGSRALAGDGCADLEHHGLEDQAVCVYPACHYPAWRDWAHLSAEGMPFGSFGENFTVTGLDEEAVHLGDRIRIGEAEVEVTKARAPCATLNKVWGRPDLASRMGRLAITGWYLRVLKTGEVAAGQAWELMERIPGAPSVAASWRAKRGGDG